MKAIGNILKELRLEKGLTLEELANDLNKKYNLKLNKGMISKWEGNKSEPTFKYTKFLAEYYSVSVDYLLGISKFKNSDEEMQNYKKNLITWAEKWNKNFCTKTLLEDFNKLNNTGKKEASKRVKELTQIKEYTYEEPKTLQDLKPTVLAAHDDDLTDDEKAEADRRILEAINKMQK